MTANNQHGTITIVDFEKLKKAERHARIHGPLLELFNERWSSFDFNDPAFIESINRIQAVNQELLDLINAGLL